jgi:hypothetical protein
MRREIEMAIGGVLIAVGLALGLTLPPPWWPEMGRYWLDLGLCLGAGCLIPGFTLVIVAACRAIGAKWPSRVVEAWDAMWARISPLRAVAGIVALVIVAPLLYTAAVPSRAATPNVVAPPSPTPAPPSVGDTGSAQSSSGPAIGVQKNSGPTYNAPVTINPPPKPQRKAEPRSQTEPPVKIIGPCNNVNQNGGSVTFNCPTNWIRAPDNEGVLVPAHDVIAPSHCSIPRGATTIHLGSDIAYVVDFPSTILQMHGEPIIVADMLDGDLVLSVLRVFDDRNDIITRIDADGFWVNPTARIKKPDASTLVVYDHLDNEILRLRFMNRNAISIEGIFRSPGQAPITIDHDVMHVGVLSLRDSCAGEVGAGSSMFSVY